MHRLNKKIEYSLMALKHMSLKGSGELTTAKEVSESYRAPFDATAKALQVMAQRGWLKSEQGATGGYVLNRDLSKISFLELVETIQGPSKVAACLKSKHACELHSSCNIVTPVRSLNQRLNQFYKGFSVQDLILEKSGAL